MSRWFRFYAKSMRDPKVLKLSDKDYRLWMNLLCIASENEGSLPCDEDLKLVLGMRLDHLKGGLNRLIRGGLIDVLGDGYEPHNWNKFQYKSDTSNERVKRFREKRNVTVTAPDTETDTELPLAKANGAKPDSDKDFWANAKSYLGGPKSGALIGKWCKDYGQGETAKAITAAQTERAVDPVPYITAVLRKSKAGADSPRMPVC